MSAWFTLWLACAAMSSVSPPLPSGGSDPPRNFVSPPAHPPSNVYPTADRHLCPPVHVPVQPPCKQSHGAYVAVAAVPKLRPTSNSFVAAAQKKQASGGSDNHEIHLALLKYYCDVQDLPVKHFCGPKIYARAMHLISRDPILKDANKNRSSSASRVEAIKQIKRLLTREVDWSSIGQIQPHIKCSGLNCPKVSGHAKVDLAFCHQHWDHSRDAWRSRKCQSVAHLDMDTALLLGWQRVGQDELQCPQCYNAKNYSQYTLFPKIVGTSPPAKTHAEVQSQVKEILMKEVDKLFCQHYEGSEDKEEGIVNFKNDAALPPYLKMLAVSANKAALCCGGRFSVRRCLSSMCNEVLVSRPKLDHAKLCPKCYKVQYNRKRKAAVDVNRTDDERKARIAPSSKTPWDQLSKQETADRHHNCRQEKKSTMKKLSRLQLLEQRLKDGEIDFSGNLKGKRGMKGQSHQHFLERGKVLIDNLLKDKKALRKNLRSLLGSIMDKVVGVYENKNKDVEVDENEKERMVDIIKNAFKNTSLKLNDKAHNCRFNPHLFQIAQSVASSSSLVFRKANNLLPIFPGKRTLRRNRQKTRVRDGKNLAPYQQRKATKKARGKLKEKTAMG